MPKVRTARAKKSIKRTLQRVPVADVKEVLEAAEQAVEERVEKEVVVERRPGMIIDGEKIPYTYKWMCDNFEIVSFIPEETIPLCWNGVRVQALTNIEMHVPKPFKEIYDNSRRERGRAPAAIKKEFEDRGYKSMVDTGAGALEPY